MDPELKRLMEETRALAADSNRMLHAMRRAQWFGFFAKLLIWAIVLLLPLYLYQQYLQPLVGALSSGTSTPASGPFGFPSQEQLQQFIGSYRQTGQ